METPSFLEVIENTLQPRAILPHLNPEDFVNLTVTAKRVSTAVKDHFDMIKKEHSESFKTIGFVISNDKSANQNLFDFKSQNTAF